eukprot:gb/GFBE01064180.1/.p1 GENE.gb/GFBE01064180.1/~~gb/GFBE01064180.1/.p1  ORF type:complete len:249 (+),score=47.83 gb/GFBE01064180.1/:1-747(+)
MISHVPKDSSGSFQVAAVLLSGETVNLSLKASHKVLDMKDQIAEAFGIPQLEQRLISGSQLLCSQLMTLSDYDISHGSLVQVVRCALPVKILVNHLQAGSTWDIHVSPKDTVADLKANIHKSGGVFSKGPEFLNIFFAGQQLLDSRNVIACGLESGSMVSLCLRHHQPSVPVFVITSAGYTIHVSIRLDDTVGLLKQKVQIQERTSATEHHQHQLYFAGGELVDTHTLAHSGIRAESTIYLHEASTTR